MTPIRLMTLAPGHFHAALVQKHMPPGVHRRCHVYAPLDGDLIASFLDEHLIDTFVVSVVPVFIGDGIPLIARRHRHVPLEVRSVERFEDGLVQLHYRVQNPAAVA